MSAKSMKQDRECRFAEPRPRRQHRTFRCINADIGEDHGSAVAELVHILRRESRQERRSA